MAKRLYARYSHPDAGNDFDKQKLEKLLKEGELYPVEKIDMGQSHTNIYLSEFGTSFNSVNFDFFTIDGNDLVLHNIYKDPIYNPYIRR